LNAVHQAALDDHLLYRRLDVQDPGARRHEVEHASAHDHGERAVRHQAVVVPADGIQHLVDVP
jgi:hypothetical protein